MIDQERGRGHARRGALSPAALLLGIVPTPLLHWPDTRPPEVLAGPAIRQNPTRWVPLAAIIDLETDEPSRVRLALDDGTRSWQVLAEPELRTDHHVAVLGMRPARTYAISVAIEDAAGNSATVPGSLTFDTEPLPDDFPPLEVTVCDPSRMEPGVTLFATRYSTPGGGPRGNYIIMLDELGEVAWYYHHPFETPSNVDVLRNGDFLCNSNHSQIEIDRLGDVVARWYPSAWTMAGATPDSILVDVDTLHHEMRELPEPEEADFVALATELRTYPSYPVSEVDRSVTQPLGRVIGDVIVEFKRDGTIVRETRLLDVLDPYRIGYGSLNGYWDWFYGGSTRDWSHANAVELVRARDSYIVSVRHQDCVVEVSRQTGEVTWILGAHDQWRLPWQAKLLTPLGHPFAWPYHQHAPERNRLGNLVLFDNGNYRAIPPAIPLPSDQWYSRAVEYAIDMQAMTVEQEWVYGGPNSAGGAWFSGALGEVDPLVVTGNVLVTDGSRLSPGSSTTFARIAEVTYTRPPEVVFEVVIEDPTHQLNWTVYRSERIAGVYPD